MALVGVDLTMLVASALLAGFIAEDPGVGPIRMAPWLWVVLGMAAIRANRLHLSRVASIRTAEFALVTRALGFAGLAWWLIAPRISDAAPGSVFALLGPGLLLVLLGRTGYRTWMRAARQQGRYVRRVLLLGADDEAAEFVDIIAENPADGLAVVGVVSGDADTIDLREHVGGVRVYQGGDAIRAAREEDASGVIVMASALGRQDINAQVRDLLAAGLHVQVSTGLRRMSHQRYRWQRIGYESVLYLEPAMSRTRTVVKRMLDVPVAALLLVLGTPVLAIAALAVKLEDGGPILFRQRRIGRDGEPFQLLKIRTMVPDAEEKLRDLIDANHRDGPLFKMAGDPRVTRVGRFLRASSIDELPQLINVLRGEMSMVGPRPALPMEVSTFTPELLARLDVLPGLTGLWQVEARDSERFGAYQRLDLFYVENWTVLLDVMILLATVRVVLKRTYGSIRRHAGDAERNVLD